MKKENGFLNFATTKLALLSVVLILACQTSGSVVSFDPNDNAGVEGDPGTFDPTIGTETPPPASTKPNILFILSDDQTNKSLSCMNKLQDLIGSKSTTFENTFATTPLCCPSRASMLTGLLAHNHGVMTNSDSEDIDADLTDLDPGAAMFTQFGNEERSIERWLKDAGYTTGMFGKYLNGYRSLSLLDLNHDSKPDNYVPAYWDAWHVFSKPEFRNFDMVERDIGETEAKRICYLSPDGSTPESVNKCTQNADEVVNDGQENYADDIIRDKVLSFLDSQVDSDKPFFTMVAFKSPHLPALPPKRYMADPDADVYTDEAMQRLESCDLFDWKDRPASVLERDTSDKPDWVNAARQKAMSEYPPAAMEGLRHRQLVSLLAIEDAVEAFVNKLREQDKLKNTVIIYLSDNGYMWGEHWWFSKNNAFEESARVPLMIYKPDSTGPRTESRFALNIDIAPTIAEFAGITLPEKVDGTSLAGLVSGTQQTWDRDEVLIECWNADPGLPQAPGTQVGAHSAIRTQDWKYVEYYADMNKTQARVRADGKLERELYDLKKDPYELENLYNASPAKLQQLGYQRAALETVVRDMKTRLEKAQAQ